MDAFAAYSDEFLFDLVKTGDRNAYAEIYDRYKGILYVHACRMLKDNDEAEDVIHDLFAVLWARKETLVLNKELRYYLYAALRNRIFKMMSHKKRDDNYRASLPDAMDETESNADHLVRQNLLSMLIEKEISCLPRKMREVFELSRKSNLSHREIAEQLEISEQTVRKHIQHSLKILRVKIRLLTVLFY